MSDLTVVVRRMDEGISLREDYVSLPKDYGKKSYFQRPDIQAIRNMVFETLDVLEEKTGFRQKMEKSRRVVIKPNLVSVYHKSGMYEDDYPESTDPRVMDAVVEWVQKYHKNILIAESSGKPMPTATSFRISGMDRIARFRKTGLVTLETCPVRRYLLPKAKVMKEIMIPFPFVGVVEGKDFYISVPKLKTNLYTRVTLGFKNAMGVIPYALRERNHSYRIDEKLADMLYILKPDLTLIDGLVGGEGNTPAPVDPVDCRLLIAGKDPVATDRVGCRIMGFDPDEIPLFQEVEKRGFSHGEAQVDGEVPVFHFRPADASLLGDTFHKHFPNVLVLAGHDLPQAPKIQDPYKVTPEIARKLEGACRGGCLAAVRSGFEYIVYSTKKNRERAIAVLIGSGVPIGEQKWWFDREGKPYTEEKVRELDMPILTVGNCGEVLKDVASYRSPGCCSPSACMLAATAAMKVPFPLLSVKNHYFLTFGLDAVGMVLKRTALCLQGIWIDCPSRHADEIYPVPKAAEKHKNKDFIPWPLPKMSWKMRKKMAGDQLKILKL
ncbi:DUF362 domain-containing protein [Blautia sp. An81]|uniref:DUF362 domain-containing protein n=1 Tax=Blautia sp. An81 TaxID=1965659 RepID=UPI000B54E071|nr:DUF362 domain-containing protein [Blautia sp. An81]OUN30023.1 hypothetical protein B5G33_10670 [Blautia sp. An81]